MAVRHQHGSGCPKCEEMFQEGHPRLKEWFETVVKKHFPEAHASCVWRGKEDQDRDFAEGKSKLRWPKSHHNRLDENGKPQSKAVDLFWLSSDGKQALFPLDWYKEIFATAVDYSAIPIRWGGTFKTLGDSNHFELA
jgi:hypothetical protein